MRKATTTEAVEMLLSALFRGTERDGPWVDDLDARLEMEAWAHHEAMDMWVPAQYLLITLASDHVRQVTREALEAVRDVAEKLLALLDLYEEARQGEHPHWAKFIALLQAPFPVRIPPNCDTRDPDVVAVMMRDIRFNGSWEEKLKWLATRGTEVQELVDGARARRLAAFEEAYGVDLADLLFSPAAKAEHAELARRFREGWPGFRPSHWADN